MEEYILVYIISVLVWAFVWGFATKKVGENKGHDGCFWWGFWLGFIGLIIVLTKPNDRSSIYGYGGAPQNEYERALSIAANEAERKKKLKDGYWECNKCGELNAPYVTSCICGTTLSENKRIVREKQSEQEKNKTERPAVSEADELSKFKKLLDEGAITEEEFQAKKKQILKL